jgi:hypothetical protein
MSATEDDLVKSRAELWALLDQKFKNVPEWRAFCAVDRALDAVRAAAAVPPLPAGGNGAEANRSRQRPADSPLPYVDLALMALEQARRPVRTPAMVDFIGQHRELDPARARVNISSALSHDERFQNVSWGGGRAWWFADRALPHERERQRVAEALSVLSSDDQGG